MNTLIIYANYKENSFTAAIRDTISDILHQNGHQIVVRDLYEMKFNPILSKEDLESLDKNIFPVDIMREQKFITWSDLMIFVYPIWWSGMPAILKGYIERIFTPGFAFEYSENGPVPLLKDKKLILINTSGSKRVFQQEKRKEALDIITKDCIFGICGMDIVEHKYFESVSLVSKEIREGYMQEVIELASKIK